MIKKALIVVVAIVVVFLVIVALQSADYHVARSATLPAPPATVFAYVNDLHKWEDWSPWAKLDPAVKNTFDGPPSGTGAIFSWAGNSKVGEGRMTITESHPNDLIRLKLEFIKPFASTAMTEFTFKPAGDQTAVTWTMGGKKDFISKAVCLFMDMDKTVGSDFERGFANLKSTVATETNRTASSRP